MDPNSILNPSNVLSPLHPANSMERTDTCKEQPIKVETPWTCEHAETAMVATVLTLLFVVQSLALCCFVYRNDLKGG